MTTPDALLPLRDRLAELGEPLPAAAGEMLLRYRDLIEAENRRYSVVSPADVARLVSRHFVESAGFLRWIPRESRRVLDFGSGGGLPGIVTAILRPESRVALLESRRRKQVFLRLAVRALPLANTEVAGSPHELSGPSAPPYDRITARSVGSIDDVLASTAPLAAPGGLLIMTKGSGASDELLRSLKRLSGSPVTLVERRIDPLTTRKGGRIGGSTLVFAKAP